MNPDDPRARRTRDRLRSTLLSLAAEQELESLTMAAVARRAEVNRATVYQHYPDLESLISDAMEGAVSHVARCAELCPLDAPRDRAPEPLEALFGHVADHAVLYRRMFSDRGGARLTNQLRSRITEVLAARFAEGARPPGFGDVPVPLHAAYLAGALVGAIAHAAGEEGSPGDRALATWRLLRG
ncbi:MULTISPECIES: TetR/AcrR family transcriptional regulator [unclassified Nocardiopsis]|uniref:TetR/AcrR family transcriptional regulator n=1 Tax=unclassified Nocardiopsis TaxID=2649073 RepID=UPI00066C6CFA|nr:MULTISPECIES: TetR/AcrR family transcriptional regulator [unclassified Nocardiopsis]MBQ1084435.1 TetR/AcrR family transcriptional regulator [Nocardiopsis sp. B62]